MNSGEPLWRLRDVDVPAARGAAPRLVVDGSLDIATGATVVLGASGAGKSTLLDLLVGHVAPRRGQVEATLPATELPLYWVPADDGLWGHVTVRRHVEAVASPGVAAGELLAAFELEHVADRRPGRLSRGERGRLAVARAIATGANVLVLDEPLAHVDARRARAGWDALRAHRERVGHGSLVFSTHDADVALAEAEHAIVLADGRVAFCGTVDELWARPPDESLAHVLGPANWLTPAEARIWLDDELDHACVRPERLEVERVGDRGADAPTVVAVRGRGPSGQLVLRDAAGSERAFHARARSALAVGDRVALRLLRSLASVLLLLATVTACLGDDGAELDCVESRQFVLPPDGVRAPGPRSVWVDRARDEVWVLDTVGRVLAVAVDDGRALRQWRMPATERGRPEGVVRLADGRLLVSDTHYHRLVFFAASLDGSIDATVGAEGRGHGEFIYPVAVTQAADGSIYVAEYGGNDRVQVFRPDGTFVRAFGSFGTGPEQLQRPSGIDVVGDEVFVADAINQRVQVYSARDGRWRRTVGRTADATSPSILLRLPYDLARGPRGRLWVIEYGAGRLTRLAGDETLDGRFGSSGRDERALATPWGLSVDGAGRAWIADTGNRRLVRWTFAGGDR